MKDKSPSKNLPSDIKFKTISTNFIFNVIIVLLSVIIIFMGYSLYQKIYGLRSAHVKPANAGAAPSIQVEVLNGCGIGGIADKFTEYLRADHFDVVQMGNYISFDVEKTIVIDRTGKMQKAYDVAKALGLSKKNVIQQINPNYFLDVSIIVGKDYNSLKPYQNQ